MCVVYLLFFKLILLIKISNFTMPYVKNTTYCDMTFSSETPKGEFYVYYSVRDLAVKSETDKEEIFRCRTVGIMQSSDGRFYLTEVEPPSLSSEHKIRVSLVYLKSPPHFTVGPYPVQIFGTLQWKNRPVIFAKVIQVMTLPTAIRVRNAMRAVVSVHLARNLHEHDYCEDLT